MSLSLNEMLRLQGITCRWTFSTYYRGVHSRSPRVFDTIEDALSAMMAKLHQHALDGEYPMISVMPVSPAPEGRTLSSLCRHGDEHG